METLPTLYWSPCAAHCIGLILDDFGKIEWIKSAVEQARSVTRYIYKHTVTLNIMRRYTFGIDIVKPGEYLFATNFMTLKQMAGLKLNLQSMVTSQEWMGSLYSNTADGLMLTDTLTNRSFWSLCILITRLVDPLLRVLSIVSSQKRAAMGYVFAGMYRAKEIVKRELPKREDYMVYWNIIDNRWKRFWHLPLHSAGFYLNPKFFYGIGDIHSNIMSGVFDCIERLVSDIEVQDRIVKEINLYRDAVGDLGRKLAVRARDTLLPGE
ncbi:Ribonuclease H-like domain containing protein [Parasponia andersonii]|uniref:Ribonuclease H-like domain containing protein n=1 Tax=Parasponia andersonii TaxID=3476 RepID=A0A2P5ATM5_PARAD|nr:Ribonuclease H-like domain containing protein [Parasponia andersonii]